jgi:2-keto-3-deoxy-L-rhamnonate aldolase RhmA
MMRENKVKRALQRGETVIGTMVSELRNPVVAQVLAAAGLDFFMIDGEHGVHDLQTVADMVQMGRLAGIIPLMRVPDHAYTFLTKPLDAGVMGIMVPRVESRAQAEEIVRCIKYPPVGKRGCGGIGGRQSEFTGAPLTDWLTWANQETLLVIQIEERAAVEDIEGIASLPGVDVLLIGPNDLSISLGVPGQYTHPLMQQAMDRVVQTAARHGVATGMHARNSSLVRTWRDKGMRFLMCDTDLGLLQRATEDLIKTLRSPAP